MLTQKIISNVSKPCYKCMNFQKNKCMIFYKFIIKSYESANINTLTVEPEVASKVRETKCGPEGKYFVDMDVT
jgi:hypothetical protein